MALSGSHATARYRIRCDSLVAITVKHKYFPAIILVTLAAYFLLLATGDGFNQSETNVVARFDAWALGTSHMYHEGGMAFDPEGLLSTASCGVPCDGRILLWKVVAFR